MGPTLNVGTAVKDFPRFRRELFGVQKLDVMSGVCFMDCNDRHDWRVEGPQMLILVLPVPIFFRRRHIVEGLGRLRLVWSGCVHRRKSSRAGIWRRLCNVWSNVGRNRDDIFVLDESNYAFDGFL